MHLCTRGEAVVLAEQIEPGDVILVKASRSQAFELLAQEIEEAIRARHDESQRFGGS